MIDLNLPEPPLEQRACHNCQRSGKERNFKGTLLHFPHEGYTRDKCWNMRGEEHEPFSLWVYSCRWCRGHITRRLNRHNPKYVSMGCDVKNNET